MRLIGICACILSLGQVACSGQGTAAESDPAALPGHLLRTALDDTGGRSLVLADELATGKKVALVFWQEWCPSCRAEAPELVAASRKYPDLEILGVVSGPDSAVDTPALVRAIRELGLPYRNVRDRDLALTDALEVIGTPTIVVLGANGRILYRGHEVPEWETLR
jgi:thiol-disulfide isomerase/thioredoxin